MEEIKIVGLEEEDFWWNDVRFLFFENRNQSGKDWIDYFSVLNYKKNPLDIRCEEI